MTLPIDSPHTTDGDVTPSLHVVVAPDSFKGTAKAADIAGAVASGWRRVRPRDRVVLSPMADGGEGTIDAVHVSVPGSKLMPLNVTGPAGDVVDAAWLRLPDGTAVIELAESSGLTLLERPAPLDATTRGLGEVMSAALQHGCTRLVVALGGSASTDGGAGALTALGARLIDSAGNPIRDGGRGLQDLVNVRLDSAMGPPSGGVTLLTDVRAPLLGPAGAARVFAPQKGATTEDIALLESGLARLATVLGIDPALPGGGAAGGTAAGLAAWGGTIVEGAPYVAVLTRVTEHVEQADIVITGEGRYDQQSAMGKAASHVRDLAHQSGASAILVAGSIGTRTDGFDDALALIDLAGDERSAMRDPLTWADRAGALLASRQ